jgi:ABC-2 type transport system ATP-binding protein
MEMELMLEAIDVTKKYGNMVALDKFSLELSKGRIMGLLGPNGSGKTTFLKTVAGVLKPNSGKISVDDKSLGTNTKAAVAFLPDRNHLYSWMRVRDAIMFFDDFYEDFDKVKAKEILNSMKINELDKIKSLSKGTLEKLNLTLIFSRNAKLYILDEPLGGTDPVAREKIIDLIISNFREDSSVLLTTHLVSNIERLFDDVAFIKDGKKVMEGKAEQLRDEKKMSIEDIYREVFKDA